MKTLTKLTLGSLPVLLLLAVGIFSGLASAHEGHTDSTNEEATGPAFRMDLKPTLLTPKERIEVRLSESKTGALPEGRSFRSIQLVHVEDRLTMFTARAEVGSAADPLRFVFPEGAPYRLSVEGSEGQGADRYELDVAPLAPERRAQATGALLLLVVYIGGVLGGFGLRRIFGRKT